MPPLVHQLPVDPDQFTDDPLLDDVQYIHFMSFQWDFFNVGSTVDNLMGIFAPNSLGQTPQEMPEGTKREVERCFWEQIEPIGINSRIECLNRVMDELNHQKIALDSVINRHVRVWRQLRAEGAEETRIGSVHEMYKVLKRVEICMHYYNNLVVPCRNSHVELLDIWERPLSCQLRGRIEKEEERLKIGEAERRRPTKFHSCNQLCEHEKNFCGCLRYPRQPFDEKLCVKRHQAFCIDERFWLWLKDTQLIRKDSGNESYPKLMECVDAWRARKEAEQRVYNDLDRHIEISIQAGEKRVSDSLDSSID